MPTTNTSSACVDKLKVLADATRLRVVEALMNGPRHVSELNSILGLEQSLLSHHLKVLRDSQLVTSERDGKSVLYRLDPSVMPDPSNQAIHLGCCRIVFD